MSRIKFLVLLSLAIVAPSLVRAQSNSLSEADKAFLMKDSRGAAYELKAAKLAVSKASRDDIRKYAEKLVNDHEKYNSELEQLGKSVGLMLPTDPDQSDMAHMEDLNRLSGPSFDMLFIKEAQRVNAGDKRDADKEKASTQNEKVKSFIANFAATDAEHERIANQLAITNG